MNLTAAEIQLGRARIRDWPKEEREFLTRLTEPEAEAIVLLVALLDIRPAEIPPEETP